MTERIQVECSWSPGGHWCVEMFAWDAPDDYYIPCADPLGEECS
jgi:hypothetical protein